MCLISNQINLSPVFPVCCDMDKKVGISFFNSKLEQILGSFWFCSL